MSKQCDHRSVGVIISNQIDAMALIKRAFFPVGIAPPAGHVDNHGSRLQAAINEVAEEVGLELDQARLVELICERRVDNACKRPEGSYHIWSVYSYKLDTAETTQLKADPTETKGAFWADKDGLKQLAERTRAYRAGEIDEDKWQTNPGLEEIWLDFLVELGYVE